MRSHPPTLTTLARQVLSRELRGTQGARVLVAVSGGPDSMALLDVMARLRKPLGIDVCAHGVDHGLRVEAVEELALAESLARSLSVPFALTRVTLEPKGNLQARARKARYAALREAALHANCSFIATGHHADDRAETVLMRLLRGSGPSGLAVLPPRAGDLLRPLIRARRADVLTHLTRHGLAFATDPSNASARFLRVRVRTELMPLLESLGSGVVGHLCALADQLTSAQKPSLSLPRATQAALSQLAAGGRGEVRLPGGLVVRATPKKRPSEGQTGVAGQLPDCEEV
jgi:tRNA(Ile)-lysidine synthase